jgi:hypothetical protein
VDVVAGESFDFVFHRWYAGIVMESFITYIQESVKSIRRNLDCILCRIFVLDDLAQPQCCTP